jgi:penicillin-binding protein 1C
MRRKLRFGAALLFLIFAIAFYFALPHPLFDCSYSTVLEARDGQLLGATIATDGQWRFPAGRDVPVKFQQALVAFEDQRFHYHPGVDPFAIARATFHNFSAGRVVSGGSTITMQVIRLAGKQPPRTWFQKIKEALLAVRAELRFSKREILALYAAHAPFGGNVVGLEAACWRYFQRPADELSWGEAALLAVLPNHPALIHPGRNRAALTAKRNRLLARLHESGVLDETDYALALAESIPEQPQPLPRFAPHLLQWARQHGYAQTRIVSTLETSLQQRVTEIVNDHHAALRHKQIHNAAALVLDVKTGNVLAYVGNSTSEDVRNQHVDVVQAPRSTGSILKPFLFAAMADEGLLLPTTLQPDIPTILNGFSPKNFSLQYDGAVPARDALTRSLNIPAVHQLKAYRYEKFYNLLQKIGITSLHQPAEHYGLALILGGAEGTLWDITGAYASLARTLNAYFLRSGSNRYAATDIHAPRFVDLTADSAHAALEQSAPLSAAAIWQTFDALREVNRPSEEAGWKNFSSARPVAWKTGTSIGFRDGWAIGVTPTVAVGVWVGNADGEGRPGLTGTDAAAPLLFSIFSALPPDRGWFDQPNSELQPVTVCAQSGYPATNLCRNQIQQWAVKNKLQLAPCPYHQLVHLSADGKHRLHAGCESLAAIVSEPWFVLPPVMEYYYKERHWNYRPLPPYRTDCANPANIALMDLIYPKPHSKVFIPKALDGQLQQTVFQAAHRQPNRVLFWHLDGQYLGSTRNSHRLPIQAAEGEHVITLSDEEGNLLESRFTVIGK